MEKQIRQLVKVYKQNISHNKERESKAKDYQTINKMKIERECLQSVVEELNSILSNPNEPLK